MDQNKHFKIERVISWYNRESEELIAELNIDHVPFKFLKALFLPREHDPLMYECYEVDRAKEAQINALIEFEFDFNRFVYFVECYQAKA